MQTSPGVGGVLALGAEAYLPPGLGSGRQVSTPQLGGQLLGTHPGAHRPRQSPWTLMPGASLGAQAGLAGPVALRHPALILCSISSLEIQPPPFLP